VCARRYIQGPGREKTHSGSENGPDPARARDLSEI